MMEKAFARGASRMDSGLPPDYVDAETACRLLAVQKQTLYAYVSRGLIKSLAQPGHRGRLYASEDVRRLESRSLARHGHGPLAASAMNYGEPIIPTSITEVTPEGPRYRGRLAIDLARARMPFEAVAELIWTGVLPDGPVSWTRPKSKATLASLTSSRKPKIGDLFAAAVLQLGEDTPTGLIEDEGHVVGVGRRIIHTLIACHRLLAPAARIPIKPRVADDLLATFSVEATEENRAHLDSILVLLADHELAPATLAVRVCASTGCSLSSCVVAGIVANGGSLTGQAYDRIEAFLDSGGTSGVLLERATELLDRGVSLPGFGHWLYPQGDPRGRFMIDLAKQRAKQDRSMFALYEFVDEIAARHGLFPRQELGTVILTRAMRLPKRVSSGLATLARVAGWLAHVQEQRMFGSVLRPRAHFVGSPVNGPL